MLGRRPRPGLFDAGALLDVDRLDGIYALLAKNGRQLFTDYQFRRLFARTGRSSASPALMALTCLLQHAEGISDRKAIERVKYDLRWKAALDLDPLDVRAPFSKTAYVGWRARLVLNEKQAVAFEKSVQEAVRAGLLPRKLRVALDGSPVRSRGALKDTYNLLADAIRKVVRAIAKAGEEAPEKAAERLGVGRHFEAQSIKGSELVDWESPEAVRVFLKGLLDDGRRVSGEAALRGCAGNEVELLSKIVEQDVDQDEELPKIKQEVAKDRTVSASDPEARHGRKSTGKTYTGHKVHVAVAVETGLVTACEVSSPSEAEGAHVKALVEQTEQTTGLKVSEALGDCAYGTATAVEQAKAVRVELRSRMPAPPKGRFGPGDFEVSEDRRAARCPAGHPSATVRGKKDVVHFWSTERCRECPLRERCSSGKNGRSLRVRPDFHSRRAREKWARSPRGRAKLKKRVAVEHAIGRAKARGAGKSRFFGRVMTRFQWLWTCAVDNLLRVASLVEAARGKQPAAASA